MTNLMNPALLLALTMAFFQLACGEETKDYSGSYGSGQKKYDCSCKGDGLHVTMVVCSSSSSSASSFSSQKCGSDYPGTSCSCSCSYAGSCGGGSSCECSKGNQKCSGSSSLLRCDDGCNWTTYSCSYLCTKDGYSGVGSEGCSYDSKSGYYVCFCAK